MMIFYDIYPAMAYAFMNWSGGKDACFSLFRMRALLEVRCLLTTVSRPSGRVSMHGVREGLLREQARQLGLPLRLVPLPEGAGMEEYDAAMGAAVRELQAEGCRLAIFGDIFLEDVKAYRQRQLAPTGIKPLFPVWGTSSRGLLEAFWAAGFQAVVTCVNARCLDAGFAGRLLDRDFLADLPEGVDPCGENGEFHSFVFDGPLFRRPVAFQRGEVSERSYPAQEGWDNRFYFCDLLEADPGA